MIKKCFLILMVMVIGNNVSAQIDLKNLSIDQILGRALNVKKGFAPKFSLGNLPVNKIAKVGEIIGFKKNNDAIRLFNTFKTGRTVYRVASFAGSAIALYSTIKSFDKAAIKADYQKPLIGAASTIGVGLLTKFLTKAASYKAVDIFNGIVKRKLKDIISVAPASSTMGMGMYVKL